MQKKRNDVKARTTLLLALPDKHQLRFSKYKTAQELWAAILKTFGGNEATKKTKKNLLKQQYGNFKEEGWDWSFMANEEENHALVADEEAPTKFALMAKSSFDNEVFDNSLCSKACKKNTDGLNTKITELSDKLSDTKNTLYHYKLGLPEFADDTITDYSRPSPAIESNSDDFQNRKASVAETRESSSTILSKPAIKFVKSADRPIETKEDKVETAKKPAIKYVELRSAVRTQSRVPRVPTVTQKFPTVNRKFPTVNRKFPTGNIKFSTADLDYEPFDGGYVSFGQGGCKITGKRTIKTGKLKFENVYFVKDLKTPRQHNIYSIDLNNVVLHKDLTCLVAKASADECMLWHRRLCHLNIKTMNRVLVNKYQNKTTYELFNGRTSAIGFLKPFGCHVMILNTLDHLGKFDAKGDEGYFIGYSMSSKAFRVFNKRTKRVEENLHVDFLENKAIKKGAGPNWLFDIDSLTNSMNYVLVVVVVTNSTNFSGTKDAGSQDVKKDVSSLRYIALPNWFHEAHLESSTSNAQDTCNVDAPESSGNSNPTATSINPPANQMETLTVETPVSTVRVRPIRTKWVLKNKKDERGIVIRNKARLVPQGHTQEEKIDYDEVFAPVARIEAIRFFFYYASFMGFTIYQMYVKSAFLYGTIDEEVYVMQPPGFQDPEFPARVYKAEKALYGLHQAPRAWYGTLSSNPQLCREFEALMHEKFQMSAMGELNFFLGLQVLQKKDGIFLSQDKYVGDILKKFRYSYIRSANTPMDKENPWGKDGTGKDVDLYLYRSMIGSLMYLTASRPDIMFAVCACARHQVTPKECHFHAVKRIFRYLKGHPKLGLWYPKESLFDLVAYSDSDYGGATQDRKATTGGSASGCGQVLWIQNQLLDYGHHFIRDCFKKKLISVDHIHTDDNVADLLTKPFDVGRFQYLVMSIGMVEQAMRGYVKGNHIIYTTFFWSTARIETTDEGTKILATVDGEGSGTPTEPHHTPSPEAQQTSPIATSSPSLPPVTTATIPTVIASDTPQLRKYTKRTRIAQSSALPPVADEPASPIGDDSQGEACLTDSGLEAKQDRANITKTSTFPSDSTPRVTSLAADEGSMQHKLTELTDLYTRLQRQQTEMTSKDGGGIAQSGEDALIKGRSLDEWEEEAIKRSTERGSDDTEEMVTVLTSLDAASILTSEIPTVSIPPAGEIPTVSVPSATIGVPTGSNVVLTASPIFITATVATPYTKRKEEEMARNAQRMNEQITRDAEIARIHAEEELQRMIDGLDRNNETVAKYLQEYHQFTADLPIGEGIELIKESERFKRKWLRLKQDSAKKVKTSEEVSKEDIKTMIQLVLVEDVYVEAIQLWALVKETLNIRQAANDKEKELWVELKRSRNIHAGGEGLPDEKWTCHCDD
uniref:Retrovirus-related Pol polyprotein from transposon TNT 1-94 n=1 Tax=Tanacetum cinerariifolium TaxID=118510 RepID=A0A6L2NL01_TANCI|nr:retrovirus-related Pol polyprotein from transposon TNT 1-94 [Tanacetum cinerariifolium]